MKRLLLVAIAAVAFAQPPVIPVGIDAYRQWERWAYQRIGARAYMRSTYDRAGGNERADASHFLYQEADDFNVTLDLQSPAFSISPATTTGMAARGTTKWTVATISSQETSYRRSAASCAEFRFRTPTPIPAPLALTWADTKGADLSWVPIPSRNRSAWPIRALLRHRAITSTINLSPARNCRSPSRPGTEPRPMPMFFS